jgi:hypothetical protein
MINTLRSTLNTLRFTANTLRLTPDVINHALPGQTGGFQNG